MKKYKLTSILIATWLFMALIVLDIFQENAICPTKMWDTFSFVFTTIFCAFSGITFYCYRNAL